MLAKEKQIEAKVKQKIESKVSQVGSHLSKPLPAEKNKTSTQNPSYIRPKKQTYLDMRKNLHQIINKASFMALRKQAKTATFKASEEQEKPKSTKLNPKQMLNTLNTVVSKQYTSEPNNIRVMGCLPNENFLTQLWALVPDELHVQTFYIYHIESNLALKIQNQKVTLAPKQKTKQFMFYIPKDNDKKKSYSIYKDYVNIMSSLNGKALALKGILQLSETNTKDECQQFYLKKVNIYQPKPLQNSYILFNPKDKDKQKAFLSVTKDKQEISYRKLDYSLYQRWVFLPALNTLDRNPQKDLRVDRIKEENVPKMAQSKTKTLMERKSKLQELNEAQISLITTVAKNLVDEYDNIAARF